MRWSTGLSGSFQQYVLPRRDFGFSHYDGSQNVNVALYLSWILENSVPGDITVPGLGSPPPNVTTSMPSTTSMLTTTTAPVTTTIPQDISEACGIPRNGGVDPFGILGLREKAASGMEHLGRLRATRRRRTRDAGVELEERIIGGTDSSPTVVCWQAFVVVNQGNGTEVTCGGVILGSWTILTAASCMVYPNGTANRDPSVYTVTVGALDNDAPFSNSNDSTGCAQTFSVQKVLPHEDFYAGTFDNDIGILILSNPIDLAQKACACPICLMDRVPGPNDRCVLSGYGVEGNDNDTSQRTTVPLKWVVQKIILQSNTCQSVCDRFSQCTNRSNFICSQGLWGQDQCTGDSGGPLFCYDSTHSNYYLAGVIAFPTSFCGAGLGGQSVLVARYLQWILDHTVTGDVQVQKVDVFTTTTPFQHTTTYPRYPTTPKYEYYGLGKLHLWP
ncbi:serine protease 55-like [Paramacrobiotus metropolitanus]|uniref:serine protease 55-like n=1 Tax=Paramacrobiotus metropolitanus TaxID=2943436 RepID=UPI0024458FCC|nr:serine protease 55-like [Paramacrobiotus metropolitanus]